MTVVPARVAGVDDDRRRVAGRPRRRRRPGPARRGRPARTSTRSSSPAAPRRSARSRTACPDAGVEPVDRIVGPGQRLGHRRQDRGRRRGRASTCPAGPSEGMVLADAAARPATRRRRPHHPGRARPGLAGHPRDDRRRPSPTPSRRRSAAVLPRALRRDILAPGARATTAGSSSRPDLDAGDRFVNAYAPGAPLGRRRGRSSRPSPRIRNAGSIFVGPWAPESAGDYATGANHVLPTGGLARSCGALAVETYGKFSQVQRIDREGLAALAADDPRRWPRPRACSPTATRSRSASSGDDARPDR